MLEAEPLVDLEAELELDPELVVDFAELDDVLDGAAVVDAWLVDAVERLPDPPATWNDGE